MKRLLLLFACVLALSACQTAQPMGSKPASNQTKSEPMAVTGEASTPMTTVPQIPADPNVQVYPTTGPAGNPLITDRTHNVLDNTTAGGYTVFDDSVTVYPLPGEDVPAFVPSYTVPPLEKQYKPAPPMVGQPIGLASAGMLPPVKNVDVPDVPDANPYANPPVPGAVRQPLTLTAPAPTTMQPPVSASPAPRSPFEEPGANTATAPKTDMNAGRRSGPMLTGY
jgi:hypothetical protein